MGGAHVLMSSSSTSTSPRTSKGRDMKLVIVLVCCSRVLRFFLMLMDKSLLICIAVKEDAKEALRKKAVACFTEQ